MSADKLRRAASLMRARAEAAGFTAPSPWWADGTEITTDDQEPIEPLCVVTSGMHWQEAGAIREHVASWHPTVALAVADWLEATARELDALGDPDLTGHPQDGRRTAALAVARAYLGADT